MPEGFEYREVIVTRAEENSLLLEFASLPFKEFDFHGYLGKRRIVSFGWKYDFTARVLNKVDDIPPFLFPLREAGSEPTLLRSK